MAPGLTPTPKLAFLSKHATLGPLAPPGMMDSFEHARTKLAFSIQPNMLHRARLHQIYPEWRNDGMTESDFMYITNPPLVHQIITRGQAGIQKPNPKYILQIEALPDIPTNTIKAIEDPDWFVAMSWEYDALINNHTWDLVCCSSE